jgi:hypothetical protein
MDKFKVGQYIIILTCLFFSCKTDFETIAEWKDITVVYGLLDQRDSVQYIKINKAFLGEGDALMFAKENDSINYPFPLNVRIEEWNEAGNKVQTIYCVADTTYKPEDPNAVFSTGAQIIYKGVIDSALEIKSIHDGQQILENKKIWLNEKSTYKLFIQYPDSSKIVSSETYLIHHFSITQPLYFKNIKFVPNPNNTTTFAWERAPNDVNNEFKYELSVIFNYQEKMITGQVMNKSLILASSEGFFQGGEYSFNYKDVNFYANCNNSIPYDDPIKEDSVIERYTSKIETKIASAAKELTLFMNIYEPSTSIVQDKPLYSNIDNGIGIYSSRYYVLQKNFLNDETVSNLKGYYNLKFTR